MTTELKPVLTDMYNTGKTGLSTLVFHLVVTQVYQL